MSEAAKLTYRQREMLTAPDSRMNAYYYSFERTGVPEVDAILSALAWAGKGMHSTQNWSDAEYNLGYGPFDAGLSYVDVIQAAANEAAGRIRALAAAVPSTTEPSGSAFSGGGAGYGKADYPEESA